MSDVYNSKIAKLLGKLNGKPQEFAITISSSCTLYSCDCKDVGMKWRKHENAHKARFKRDGESGFDWLKLVVKYFYYNITVGYMDNPYEVEARQ